jgi:steroid delta-isomerase-like uncharacterized protein
VSDQNKALVRRSLEEVWNQGKLALIAELTAPNATYYDANVPGGKFTGPEGVKQFVEIYRTAFPDVRITINDQVADGDKVATRWTATGTHKGQLMGIPATNKHATVTGINIDRFHDGKVVESWANYDMFGMLQQLGVAQPLAAAAKA